MHQSLRSIPPGVVQLFVCLKMYTNEITIIMSTSARITMKDYDGEGYCYSLFSDGYPDGVIPYLPEGKISYEKLRQNLRLSDEFERMPDFLYEIDLKEERIQIYYPERTSHVWQNGEQLFEGTFSEAKAKVNSEGI